jgi:hypothetical protein
MDELTPTPAAPLMPVPGVQIPTGNVALRCPTCNRTSQWNETFVKANRGQNVVCPLCAAAVRLP